MSSNAIKVFELHLDSIDDKDSQDGKLLKAAFIKGPSIATKLNGEKVIVKVVDKFNSYSDFKNKSSDTENDKDSTNNNDRENSNKNNENYSIFGAYLDTYPIFERNSQDSSKDSKRKEAGVDSELDKTSGNIQDKAKSDAENDKNTDTEIDAEIDASFKAIDKVKTDAYYKVHIKVGIKDQGYTEWGILINKSVSERDFNLAIAAIQMCKFEYAYNLINSKKTNLIVKFVATYLYKDRKDNVPPFIGYGRYAIDSGSDEGIEESVTICLAVAPVNISTGKPSGLKSVLKSVYNVNITNLNNGILSKILTGISNLASDKRDSSSNNRYANERIHQFLQKNFKCIGDERFYTEYEKIVKFIRKQVAAGHLEFDKNQSTVVSNEYALNTKNSLILF